MKTLFTILLTGCIINFVHSQITTLDDLDTAMSNLIDMYFDKQSVIPKQDISSAITVDVQFSLSALKAIDVEAGQVAISGYLTSTWTDERYPANTDAVSVMVSSTSVWTPTLTLVNGVSSTTDTSRIQFTFNTAALVWKRWVYETASCKMNVFYFPFDSQECTFRYASLDYSSSRLVLSAGSTILGTNDFTENSEWTLEGTSVTTSIESSTSYIQFTIRIKRKSIVAAVKIIVPAVLIGVLSIFCLLMPLQGSDRVAFSSVCILVVFLVYLFNSPQIPSSSTSTPLILYFLFAELFFSGLVLMLSILSVRIGTRTDPENIPGWLTTVVSFMTCNFNATDTHTKTGANEVMTISEMDQETQNNHIRQNGALRQHHQVTPESAWDDDIQVDTNENTGQVDRLKTAEETMPLTWKDVGKTLDILFMCFLLFIQIVICCGFIIPLALN